jgi:hypothetical protein
MALSAFICSCCPQLAGFLGPSPGCKNSLAPPASLHDLTDKRSCGLCVSYRIFICVCMCIEIMYINICSWRSAGRMGPQAQLGHSSDCSSAPKSVHAKYLLSTDTHDGTRALLSHDVISFLAKCFQEAHGGSILYIVSVIIPICIYPHIRSASSRSVRSQGMTLQWHDLEEVYPTKGAAINIVSCISYHAISFIC